MILGFVLDYGKINRNEIQKRHSEIITMGIPCRVMKFRNACTVGVEVTSPCETLIYLLRERGIPKKIVGYVVSRR